MHRKPRLIIPVLIQIIGWIFILWSIGNLISFVPPHAMLFLHFILGIVFILNGVALYRITDWTR